MKSIQDTYGKDHLHLTVIKGYVAKLMSNKRVAKSNPAQAGVCCCREHRRDEHDFAFRIGLASTDTGYARPVRALGCEGTAR